MSGSCCRHCTATEELRRCYKMARHQLQLKRDEGGIRTRWLRRRLRHGKGYPVQCRRGKDLLLLRAPVRPLLVNEKRGQRRAKLREVVRARRTPKEIFLGLSLAGGSGIWHIGVNSPSMPPLTSMPTHS